MPLSKAFRENVYNGEIREEFRGGSICKGTYRILCSVPDISFVLILLPVLNVLLVMVPIFDKEIHFIYVITSWTVGGPCSSSDSSDSSSPGVNHIGN
jgi:hypothetical protein